MTNQTPNRQPSGRPTGGQFSANAKSDAEVSLGAGALPPRRGALLARGDFGPYKLVSIKAMRGREGDAWSAELKVNKVTIGLVNQDGYGGETWIHWTDQDARAAYEEFVAENWQHSWGASEFSADGFPHTAESVLDQMFSEHAQRQVLRRQRSRKLLPIVFPQHMPREGGELEEYQLVSNAVGGEAGFAHQLEKEGTLEGALYFDGDAWLPLADLIK